jgi:NitT/TauT family transport system substrate-binding protein
MISMSRRQLGALGIAAAGTTLVGCSSKATPKSNNKKIDEVTYVTGFATFGREGYVYVADAKGFFAEQNIKVTINAGNAGTFNLAQLDANKTQFTILDFTESLTRYAAGHTTYKIIAPIHQQTLMALMALEGRGITSARDLANKKLVQAAGAPIKLLFPTYAKETGLDPKSVTWLPEVGATTLPQLLVSKQADAIGQFVVGAPAIGAAAASLPGSPKPVTLAFGDVITDLYGNTLVTSNHLVKDNPDLVRRFTKAIFKGLSYAVQNPKEAGDIIQKAVPTTKSAVAAAELTLMANYTQPGSSQFGHFDDSRVMKGIALLESLTDDKGAPLVPATAKLTPSTIIAAGVS